MFKETLQRGHFWKW